MASPSGGKPIDQGYIARAGRAIADKLNDWFGPNQPQPISAPPGTPPRSFDYPTGYNIQIQPRNLEATSFEQMRNLADSFDLVRLCIETRKDQIAKMKWAFAVKKKADEKPGDYKKRNNGDARLQQLTDFFASPDQEHSWKDWVRLLMEDMLVIDAPSIVPVTDADGTLWKPSQKIYGMEVIDGATIARKIDANGRTPQPPNVAYQQIIKGIPAVDFQKNQLVYKPRNIRVNKFFGFSPVEQIIMTINIGLRRQVSLLNYYTEGNIPEAIAQVPNSWSADQIAEFQDWFDGKLAGNLATRRRITFVPEAGTIQFTRDPKLKDELDEWLVRVICFAFSISPQPFIKMMNRATAETSVEQATAEGSLPVAMWLEDVINDIVRLYFGYNDIEFSFQSEKDANPVEQTKIQDLKLRNGSLSLDEAREDDGRDPLPNGAGSRNLVYTASGVTPIDTAIENADNPPEPPAQLGTDGKPVDGQPPNGKQPKDKEPKTKAKKVYRGYEANQHPSRK